MHWLGFDWGKNLFYASDYFERLYEWAEEPDPRRARLCRRPVARRRSALARGTLTEPGKNSPFRDRTVEENLDLFRRMKAGEFPNGARVLRAKIDMASGNINLRDPVLYRILHAHHPRTGDKWSIYPSYDYAHGQSDAIEGITHSICTLEFEDHRPLYEWLLDKLPVPSKPHQYEFARLNLTYTLLSKRVLTELVRDGHVAGWDDPRMPTIAGLKRRGVPPAAIREFVKRIGVAKANSVVDVGMLEFCIREELNQHGAAAHGGAAAAQGRDRELSGRAESRSSRRSTIPTIPPPARARSRSAASSISSRTTSWKIRRRSSSGCRRATKCGCATPISSSAREVVKNAAGEVDRAALHLRSRDQGRQRARRPQGQGDHALAVGGAVGAGRNPHLQPAVRQARARTPPISPPTSIRSRWKS